MPKLADSIQQFWRDFQSAPHKTPHSFAETIEKDHGRIEVRRCYAFGQIECLHRMFPSFDERFRVVSAGSYFCFRLFWSLALVDTLAFLPGSPEGKDT